MAKQKENLVGTNQSIEQAFGQILRTNLATTREWEAIVLTGDDPEGVHQMRVCLRRMRSALTLFRPVIPRKITRSFFREMRWAAKTLDRARDLDVYIADNLSSKGRKRSGKMRKLAMKHRERAYNQLADFILGEHYRKICDEFSHWIETQGWRIDISDKQMKTLEGSVIPFASKVLDRQRTRVLDDGRDIGSLESEALHQLRIDCKKLRYAAEFFASFYGKPMKDYVGHLKVLQDLLGTLHDTAVMPDLQKDLLKGKKNRSLTCYTRRLINKRNKQARVIRKALNKSWGGFSNAERPWLDEGAHPA